MATYDIHELRDKTYRYEHDPTATIPCPDCHHREALTLAEDQPFVAALLSYCPLCDGARYVSQARALAVLPYIAQYVKELRASGGCGEEECPMSDEDREGEV